MRLSNKIICILTILASLCIFTSSAQDSKPKSETIAHVTTFNFLKVRIDSDFSEISIGIQDDGKIYCSYLGFVKTEHLSRKELVEVETQLSEAELKTIKEAFLKLEIDSLKSSPKPAEKETDHLIIIRAHVGEKVYQYQAFINISDNGKVHSFIQLVHKMASDFLK